MTVPEVEAAARRDAVDAPPQAPKERRPGRPKKETGALPGATTPGSPRSPGRPTGARKTTPLAPKIQELIGTGGLLLSAAGMARGDATLMYDGERVLAGAERLAVALDKAAQDNPALRRTLEMLIVSTVWGELATAAAAIVLPILAAHGVVPEAAATVVGAPPPPARPERAEPAGKGNGNGPPPGRWSPLNLSDFPAGAAGNEDQNPAP